MQQEMQLAADHIRTSAQQATNLGVEAEEVATGLTAM